MEGAVPCIFHGSAAFPRSGTDTSQRLPTAEPQQNQGQQLAEASPDFYSRLFITHLLVASDSEKCYTRASLSGSPLGTLFAQTRSHSGVVLTRQHSPGTFSPPAHTALKCFRRRGAAAQVWRIINSHKLHVMLWGRRQFFVGTNKASQDNLGRRPRGKFSHHSSLLEAKTHDATRRPPAAEVSSLAACQAERVKK
jgi:hypothetical protein